MLRRALKAFIATGALNTLVAAALEGVESAALVGVDASGGVYFSSTIDGANVVTLAVGKLLVDFAGGDDVILIPEREYKAKEEADTEVEWATDYI